MGLDRDGATTYLVYLARMTVRLTAAAMAFVTFKVDSALLMRTSR